MILFSLIIPTRGRIEGFGRLLDSLRENARDPTATEVIAVVDDDDFASQAFTYSGLQFQRVVVPRGQTMGNLNLAGYRAAIGRYLMLLNDDVVVRTRGWDSHLERVCARYPDGIVLAHVNDGIFRDSLCTFPLVTREFCRIAGGICRPEYRRYRIDDHIHHIFDLIHLLGYTRRVFLPDLVFEHANTAMDPSGSRQYVPDPAIQELDNADFEALLPERRRVALACVDAIEGRARGETSAARLRMLECFPDSIALRRRENARWWPSANAAPPGRVMAAVISSDPLAARECLEALRGSSRDLPVIVVPRRNDALNLCRTDYLALLDPAVRISAHAIGHALDALQSDAQIAVGPGGLLIDMPCCGHLRFDEPEDVARYLDRARAAGFQIANWTARPGQARKTPVAQNRDTRFPLMARLGFRFWTMLARLRRGIPDVLFDPAWYRARYPEVASSGADPWLHYLLEGGFHGYDPNPHFHSAWYLAENPDVAASGMNPFVHFLRYGASEGRNPNLIFDTGYYISKNPDLAGGRMNPLVHFVTVGMQQGQRPSPGFPLAEYMERVQPYQSRTSVTVASPAPLSVIIPTRNRADRLLRTLELCRRYGAGCELEFLVMDDGSTDGTPAVLSQLAAANPLLRWQSLPAGGPGRARNVAAALARHPVLMFIGDDIEPANEQFFRIHAAHHGESEDPTFAVLGKVEWPADGQLDVTFAMRCVLEDGSQFAFSRIEPGEFVGWRYFYTSNLSVKKSLVQDWEAGGFDTGFPGAAMEDVELAYRLSKSDRGLRLYYDPASLGLHHHAYTLGAILDRQYFVGQSLHRMLKLHPELADDAIHQIDEALARSLRRDDAKNLHCSDNTIEKLKAFARVLEVQDRLGSEPWHATLISALLELCMHNGYISAAAGTEGNVSAGRADILNRFFHRVPEVHL